MDQLIFPTPRYFAHLHGTLTCARYQIMTIFVDHFSGAGFVHLQGNTLADKTIEATCQFESWADSDGMVISHYHADNGTFVDNHFQQAVCEKQQCLRYDGT